MKLLLIALGVFGGFGAVIIIWYLIYRGMNRL